MAKKTEDERLLDEILDSGFNRNKKDLPSWHELERDNNELRSRIAKIEQDAKMILEVNKDFQKQLAELKSENFSLRIQISNLTPGED